MLVWVFVCFLLAKGVVRNTHRHKQKDDDFSGSVRSSVKLQFVVGRSVSRKCQVRWIFVSREELLIKGRRKDYKMHLLPPL